MRGRKHVNQKDTGSVLSQCSLNSLADILPFTSSKHSLQDQHFCRKSIICLQSQTENSYNEFFFRSLRVSSFLKKNIDDGDRVAILMKENDVALLYVLGAVSRADGILTMLNTHRTADELRKELKLVKPRVIVFDDKSRNVLLTALSGKKFEASTSPLLIHVPTSRSATSDVQNAISHFAIEETSDKATHAFTSDSSMFYTDCSKALQDFDISTGWKNLTKPAAMFFTSGTTSSSKAVVLTHQSLLLQSLTKVSVVPYSESTVYLHLAPLFHVGGASSAFSVTLARGQHIIPEPHCHPSKLVAYIRRYKINTLVVVPAILQKIVDFIVLSKQKPVDTIEVILSGGGCMTNDLRQNVDEAFGRVRVVETYAMTETASSLGFRDVNVWKEPKQSAGYRIAPHVDIGIRSENGKIQVGRAANGLGEIVTRGSQVMQGYWQNEKATRSAFVGSTDDKEAWLATGDLGYIGNDDTLHVKGRSKDMIKSGGENVFSSEVESVLTSHPNVRDAAIFGVKHRNFGEAVVGAVQYNEYVTDMVDAPANLRKWCKCRLSGYKVPRALWQVNEVPKTVTGKTNKSLLQAILQDDIRRFLQEDYSRSRKRLLRFTWRPKL